jgi:hypothetical protein
VHVDEINPDVLIFKIKQQSKSLTSAFKKRVISFVQFLWGYLVFGFRRSFK